MCLLNGLKYGLRECFMLTWKTCEFYYCWVEYSVYVCYFQLVHDVVQIFYFLIDHLCLVVLSINGSVESEILKPPTVTVESSISSLKYYKCVLRIFLSFDVQCIYVYNCYIFLIPWSFYHYVMSLLFFVTIFDINSILSDISIATLALFWLLFAWSLFPSFHFQSMHVLKSKVSLADST